MASDESDSGNLDPVVPVSSHSPPGQVSSFIPTEKNTIRTPGISTTYHLRAQETLVIQGEYTLRTASGSIRIYGATLTPESGTVIVFAPSTHALPVIEAVIQARRYESKPSEEEKECDAVVVVGCHTSGIREMGKICPLFRSVWLPSTPRTAITDQKDSFHLITTWSPSLPSPLLLSVPITWSSLLSDFTTPAPSPPIILLTGPKESGKSTFARLLTNTLLTTSYNQVAYLDLDPGQPEFTPPGLISLSLVDHPILGPPYTHPAGPIGRKGKRLKAHHLGYVSPREDPGAYIRAACDLMQAYYKLCEPEAQREIPLIINTCGWIKGTGLELLNEIINFSNPSDMILIHSQPHPPPHYGNGNVATAVMDIHALTPHTTRFYHVQPALSVGTSQRYSAADLRTLHTISYFHHYHQGNLTSATPDSISTNITWSFKNPLTHHRPYILPASEVQGGVHILDLTPPLPSDLVGDAIEGSIVGIVLVATESQNGNDATSHVDTNGENAPEVAMTPIVYPPNSPTPMPETSHCVGLAVIRAIENPTTITCSVFQLVFPHGDTYIAQANDTSARSPTGAFALALVRGRLEVPIWDFVFPAADGTGGTGGKDQAGKEVTPWVVYDVPGGGKAVGVRKWRFRRNLMRRGQMKATGL